MEILISLLLFLLLMLKISLSFQSSKRQKSKTGFKVYPLVGILPDLFKNRRRFLDWSTEILTNCPTNTVSHRRFGKVHDVITANPSNVEYVLKTNFNNYPKGQQFGFPLVDFFGRGLFTSDGEIWKVHRKTVTDALNAKSFRNLAKENVVEIETRLIRVLAKASESGRILDLQNVLERFGFDNVGKLVFDVELGCLEGDGTAIGDEFMRAYDEATKLSTLRFIYPSFLWKLNKYFNLGTERRLRESIATVHGFVDNVIRSRINDSNAEKGGADLLSQLIGDDNGKSLEFLRDTVVGFILAAQDTTSSALTWFFWLISSRPDIQHKILKELESIRVRNGKNIGDSYNVVELRDMHYLHAAISESMRLYPPVPLNPRMCLNNDVLPDGTFLGKDSTLTYNAYAMGRMESIWGKDCSEFRPERWLQDGLCRSESPYRYPIFNAGPRMCYGKDMAYIQMKSIVAAVIDRFEIEVQNKDTCPKHFLSFSLKMKGGLPVTIGLRK